jgi:serine/threonine protein kinase
MQPGERVAGRFEIVGEAARGGMGTVFRARDRRDRRDVALKVLQANALGHVARFEREATILAGLRHPNIVEYISHGATPDGVHYLVMEWVEGETLAHRLANTGLAAPEIVALARQLCRALAALHDRGVVHRDVKPSNVMLAGGDVAQVKLVDLGIARRTADATRLTRTGVTIGTAGYLAPELVRGGSAPIDGRADLFALGCVLHECFAGAPAFHGESPLAVSAKVLLHDPPPLRTLDPATPPALEALVSALLARRPDQRPAGAADVERTLGELGTLPDPARPAGDPWPVAPPTVSGVPARLCGVLVARPDEARPWALPDLDDASITLEAFDDGLAVVMTGELAVAARLGLAIAAAAPGAQVVVATGGSPDACIDRCARTLADLEIATQVSDPRGGAGVWIERASIDELAGAFRLAVSGRHARIVGEAS